MTLLSGEQIAQRSDEIFLEDTFERKCLRAAAYDLRVRGKDIETTGSLSGDKLTLMKGQTAILETYELISMPPDLAGNIGVKYRLGIQGLFVSPGLFVDPCFGAADGGDKDAKAGRRLRFTATNLSKTPISIALGESGDHVIAVQFLTVDPSGPNDKIGEVAPDPQGLAFFEDLTQIETKFQGVETVAHRTQSATERVVVFGVFLVALTILGASFAFILAVVASGDAVTNTVSALNELDMSNIWTLVLVIVLGVIAGGLVVLLAFAIAYQFRRLSEIASPSPTKEAHAEKADDINGVPGQPRT